MSRLGVVDLTTSLRSVIEPASVTNQTNCGDRNFVMLGPLTPSLDLSLPGGGAGGGCQAGCDGGGEERVVC